MSAEFDPYYLWLGIPPAEQPPNHYRLLGVVMFESNRSVIEAAADRQMTFLRQYGTGPHSDASQKLLNEVSQAQIDLLNAEKRAAYDARLKKQIDQEVAADRSNVPVAIEPAAKPAPPKPAAAPPRPAPAPKPAAPKKPARASETYSLSSGSAGDDDEFDQPVVARKPLRTGRKPARSRSRQAGLPRWAVVGGASVLVLLAAMIFWPKRSRAGNGTLELDVQGGGTVIVDGKPIDRDQWKSEITLPAGQHTAVFERDKGEVVTRRFWIETGLKTEVELGGGGKGKPAIASSDSDSRSRGRGGPKGPKPPKGERGRARDDRDDGAKVDPTQPAPGTPQAQAAVLKKLFDRIPQALRVQVRMVDGNQPRAVNAPDNIPDEPFVVDTVQLLGQSGATSGDVAALAAFPELRQLYLDGPIWTGAELEPLKGHAALQNVDMRLTLAPGNAPAADRRSLAFSHLVTFPALVHINIDSAYASDSDLLLLKGNDRLRNLTLLADDLTSEGLAAIGTMPNLQLVYLSWLRFGARGLADDDLKTFNGLSRLASVHLSGCPELTGAGFQNVSGLSSLTMARFIDCPKLSDEALQALVAAAPKIDFLSLNAKGFGGRSQAVSAVTDKGLEALRPLDRMQSLTIHGATGITNEGIKALAALPLLQRLDLTNARINNDAASDLAALKKLRNLTLAQTDVGDEACGSLAQLVDLDFLALEFTQVSDAGLARLAPLKALRVVRVGGSKVTQKGADDFRAEHPMCQVIGPFQ